jgi:hypothetical protein
MNKKEIVRDQRIEIKLSKEEKDLWIAYAEEMQINPTRLARNILMEQAEENILSKKYKQAIVKAYIKYCEVTKNKDALERIKQD